MSDDALVDLGAEHESRLAAIRTELSLLEPRVAEAVRALRIPGIKLAANIMIGTLGIVLAPPTGGISLILTAASGGMAAWDGFDIGRDVLTNRPDRVRLRALRREATMIADELEAILAELNNRPRNGR